MSNATLHRRVLAALCATVLLTAAPVTRADEAREEAAAAAAERFSERLELEIERAKLAAELARLGKLPGAIVTKDAILFVDGAEIPLDGLQWVDPVARRIRRAARTDTVIRVAPGVTLSLNNRAGGDIRVVTWDRDEVRIEAEHDRADELITELKNSQIKLGVGSRHPSPAEVEWKLTVPAWLPVTLMGDGEIELTGLRSAVRATSVRGDIVVVGCQGPIEANSIEGEVLMTDVSGNITAASINNLVRLVRVVGPVEAQSINGDIQMEKVESVDVDASTVNGRVYYASGYRPRGRYTFSSHNGRVIVPVPKKQNVNVTLSSFQGQIESSMRVPKPAPRVKGRSMHAMRFKVRDGAWTPDGPELTAPPAPRAPRAPRSPRARVAPPATPELEIESFGGLIRLASQEEVLTLLTNQRSLLESSRAQRAHSRKASADARRQARAHRHAPDNPPTPETPPPPPPQD